MRDRRTRREFRRLMLRDSQMRWWYLIPGGMRGELLWLAALGAAFTAGFIIFSLIIHGRVNW